MPKKTTKKTTKKRTRKPKAPVLYEEPTTSALREFVQYHDVNFFYGMSEIRGTCLGFKEIDGMENAIVRVKGETIDYPADKVRFIKDLGQN